MSLDTVLIIAFVIAALVGAVIGSILLFRDPASWIGFGKLAFKELRPLIVGAVMGTVLKRMDPKEEEAWRKCMLRGGKWDHKRKRCI
jgi:hypothetical protein